MKLQTRSSHHTLINGLFTSSNFCIKFASTLLHCGGIRYFEFFTITIFNDFDISVGVFDNHYNFILVV